MNVPVHSDDKRFCFKCKELVSTNGCDWCGICGYPFSQPQASNPEPLTEKKIRLLYGASEEDLLAAIEGIKTAQCVGGDSICFVCKEHQAGGIYAKNSDNHLYCLNCWIDKWLSFTPQLNEFKDPDHDEYCEGTMCWCKQRRARMTK